MVCFYCTKCGAALQVEDAQVGRRARCVECASVVRTPETVDFVPFARQAPQQCVDLFPQVPDAPEAAASPPQAVDEIAAEVLGLNYGIASYPPPQFRTEDALQELAERLERVEHDAGPGEDNMTECRICGSTIAPFIRHCPFCRNSLVARA